MELQINVTKIEITEFGSLSGNWELKTTDSYTMSSEHVRIDDMIVEYFRNEEDREVRVVEWHSDNEGAECHGTGWFLGDVVETD